MWLVDYLIALLLMFVVGFSLLFLGMFMLGPSPSIDNGFHTFLSILVMGISTFSGIFAFSAYFSFRDKMDRNNN